MARVQDAAAPPWGLQMPPLQKNAALTKPGHQAQSLTPPSAGRYQAEWMAASPVPAPKKHVGSAWQKEGGALCSGGRGRGQAGARRSCSGRPSQVG